mgnify:CR=1 FL=1
MKDLLQAAGLQVVEFFSQVSPVRESDVWLGYVARLERERRVLIAAVTMDKTSVTGRRSF